MSAPVAVASARAGVPTRGMFISWIKTQTRNRDTDQFGHVNHAAIATLFEEGRIALVFTPELVAETATVDLLVASLSMTFHKELRAPGSVEIGSIVTRIGTSSFCVDQAVFTEATCFASAAAVCVLLGKESRKPAPVSDLMRAGLLAGAK